MNLTKIHELPKISFDLIKDTDILIIENPSDTWQIPIADLKIIFSNDVKIQSIYNALLDRITEICNSMNSINNNLDQFIIDIRNAINTIQDNIQNNNRDIVIIKANIESINNQINSITTNLSSLDRRVSNLERISENYNTEITNIKSDLNGCETNINNLIKKDIDIQNQIDSLNKSIININAAIESMDTVSSETINNLRISITENINTKYNEIMQILDDKFHQTPIIV